MKKFQQYLSSNLLSLTGYIFVIFCSLIIFYLYPQAIEESLKNGPTDNFEVTVGTFFYLIKVIAVFLGIETVLSFLIFIESIFYKHKKNLYDKFSNIIPNKIKNIHTILFYIGIAFASIPVLLLVFFIFNIIVESIFLY